jgi:60S ribosome subunit biogenesis protein NIP7
MKSGFREPSKRESRVIDSAIRYFGSDVDWEITVFDSKKKEIYALSSDLLSFLNERQISTAFAGLKLGEVGRRLRLTVEGAFLLVKKKKKRVYVSDRGEMLFLYGRDLFSESIVNATKDIKENDIVFVCNRAGDILGIGKSRYSADKLRSVEREKIVVENLIDRGEYLRKKKINNSF